MKLLFGGAYNGKLKYVRKSLGISEKEIFYCKEDSIDF
ncbi:cobalamin biosynthesis protein CobU, partial [Clostridium perfringens]|nr:cobalamin biosynthesis protein CobU [Clostridium perfringens]